MAVYQFTAMNSSGQEVKDEIEASSNGRCHHQDSRQKGFFPDQGPREGGQEGQGRRKVAAAGDDSRTAQARKSKLPFAIGGGGARSQLVGFTRQLSTLQDAGLPILRSLQILEQQQKPGLTESDHRRRWRMRLKAAATLSDAMSQVPQGVRQACM